MRVRFRAVAPLAGAWIEIAEALRKQAEGQVAPLAGAWIEIHRKEAKGRAPESHPLRVRG